MATFVVGAAIVDSLEHPTRLLATQRSYPEALAGQWEFPGGKVEEGESPEQALQREIREELRSALIIGRQVRGPRSGDWEIPVGRMRIWLAQIAPEGPPPTQGPSHRDLRWVDRSSIRNLPWLPGDIQIIPELLSFFTE
ncbi:MAG: (deoxy)nucleoside triphosphate pyrophosphohydrolase [Ancrocorticia sp.]|uniref:(deoxy)nucleoside triphosphate pyrophosphohydrolase n=1 Tax=Ancrocorticia sp. TaxID=2593684 RepID=UPI003F8F18D3